MRAFLLRRVVVVAAALTVAAALLAGASSRLSAGPIRIGVALPVSGNAAGLAGQELRGIEIAADMVNAAGGVNGRSIGLDVRDVESADGAAAAMAALRADGVQVVIGGYSSDLSIAASTAAATEGLVYWESGAVADRLTGRGLPMVFRVGASGANLGSNSAAFAATQLAPRLGRSATELRLAVVAADDDYARSVADAAVTTAGAAGVPIVARTTYDLAFPEWPRLMSRLAASRPDVIILASHIPDGIAFRRAMLTAGLKVDALIGSTMAECDPDFAGELGADAVGIFASDRPTGGFRPEVLDPAAQVLYERFATTWAAAARTVPVGSGSEYGRETSSESEYTISGPAEPATGVGTVPTEEGLSGFSAAWALLHDVLPSAGAAFRATDIAAAARALDLRAGSLPNGAGIRFASDPSHLGQNERASAVIWQWQGVRSYAFVWPATYATGPIEFLPLTR